MTLTPNLIACLAIGGAGILTALLSVPFFRHTGTLRRKCSARTTGTVIRYRLQRRGSGCGTSIAPVVEFQAAGETYTACRHSMILRQRLARKWENVLVYQNWK